MTDGLDRLKVLINSSTPIVVMETSEEMRAVSLVRTACTELNMEKVAAAAKGYSGAEIDAAVQGALYAAYSEKKPLSTKSRVDALGQTVPLSTTRAEEIAELREWARTRAVPASAGEASPARA
jgi:SpoVK/Ycf46/Vps4 family AAA+-type ATPase